MDRAHPVDGQTIKATLGKSMQFRSNDARKLASKVILKVGRGKVWLPPMDAYRGSARLIQRIEYPVDAIKRCVR